MCVYSMVMNHGLDQQIYRWQDPIFKQDFEDLLKKAKQYDKDHNQPNCETDEKKQALQKIAYVFGVEINFPK